MYAITIKFDWQSEGDNYHFLEARGERYGNVIFGKKTDGLFGGYCPLTYQNAEFTSLEEAKAWVISEVRNYFEEQWGMTELQEILGKTVLIPKRLIRSNSLTNHDKAVFGALSYLAVKAENDSPDTLPSHCQVTESEIAELLGMQDRNVSTALTKLQACQYIKWSAVPMSKGLSNWGYQVELFWD